MENQKKELLVEIEYVSTGKSKDDKYIFVRKLENKDFVLTKESEIEGCPIKELGFLPRTEKKGTITLVLKTRSDLCKFVVGQIANLKNIR